MRSDRLREQRNKMGYTLEELADRLRIHSRQLSRYEHAESDPTAEVVARMAKELQVTADYLLGVTNTPTPILLETDLSPDEAKLVTAFRRGQIKEALKILTLEPDIDDHTVVAPVKPAANS